MTKKISPLELLRDLVAYPSISGTCNSEIIGYIEEIVRSLGFSVVRIESDDEPKRANLLCTIGPPLADGLMFSGHVDVVPVKGQDWHFDPFVLTEKDGLLYGRGTVDMKGFIASLLSALMDFPLKRLSRPLSLLFTYDEETGCIGSAQATPMLSRYLRHLPQAAIIGEPTDFSIVRMHTGHVTVRISAKGKGAHSSDPDLGVSAIKALHHAMKGLYELESDLRRERSYEEDFKRPFVVFNIGKIYGGTAVNIIPDEAYALIGFRPLPDTSINYIIQRIEELCLKYQPDSRATISVVVEKSSPAMYTKPHTKLDSVLRPHAKAEGLSSVQYSTDAGNISLAGIETLIFGPGSIDVAHCANEFIKKSDLYEAKEKWLKIISSWTTL